MGTMKAGIVRTCSLLLALFAGGCGLRSTGIPEPDPGELFVFDPLALGQAGAFTSPVERVLRDEAAWRAAQDSLRLNLPPAAVDFEQSMVLLLALPQESGGYSIEVLSVESLADTLVVEYELAVPASDCITIAGRSLPFQAVAVRRSDSPVRFVRSEITRRCTWRQNT